MTENRRYVYETYVTSHTTSDRVLWHVIFSLGQSPITSIFILFMFLGFYRMYTDLAALNLHYSLADVSFISGNNEFQSLLATAYDVLQLKKLGAHLPWYLYINDFINILPPQQLVPFEKITASEWYLRKIGMSGTGVGFMWGVISQSIIGLDWFELAFSGSILGYILALVHRWYVRHQSDFIATIVYIYLCLRIYYTFRDTTFSVLAYFVWEIVPFFILLRLVTSMMPHQKYRSQHNFL